MFSRGGRGWHAKKDCPSGSMVVQNGISFQERNPRAGQDETLRDDEKDLFSGIEAGR
jgi:hypothetical protein